MNILLLLGIIIVNIALICYSLFFFSKKSECFKVSQIAPLVLGVISDFVSTILMILGSHRSLITFHGLIGYTALLGMGFELTFVLITYKRNLIISRALKISTKITYFWWLFVYLAGLVMIMNR